MSQQMLTTTDNPYSPFDQYELWNSFDQAHDYHTAAYLARIVVTSDELSEEEQEADINLAIGTIVDANILGVYRSVVQEDFKK